MKTIVNCRQMKELDANTIQNAGLAGCVLMERAALAVKEELDKEPEHLRRVLVVCGNGNNGGDGIAIARLLHLAGVSAELYCPGNPEKMTPEARKQLEIAQYYSVPQVNNPEWAEYTTIVDAIFGVGLAREVRGIYGEIIENINRTQARVVAVDIPSGIHGDTGEVMGIAVKAEETVTFAFLKTGLCLYPGAEYAGEVTVKDIGIYGQAGLLAKEPLLALEEIDLRGLPRRSPDGNKGTFGKVLAAAGSLNMSGAAFLCAKSCFRAGAGMVKIHTVEGNREILQKLLPEAMLDTDTEDGIDEEALARSIAWCDVAVVGPGLGHSNRSRELVEYFLYHCPKPMVLDADALNTISLYPEFMELVDHRCIVTPHMGEMSRLCGKGIGKLKRSPIEAASDFAREHNCVCVLKDARTVIADGTGSRYLNLTGNEGMATAGSGDVLSGLLAGLLAQGLPTEKAAPLGVYLHGLAGDIAKERQGSRGMMASDIIDAIYPALLVGHKV